MIEIQMLIPVADNKGVVFAEAHHALFEVQAIAVFGGFTRLPHEAAGGWVNSGVYYPDRTRVYVLALDSIVNGVKVGELATFAKIHYVQEAIYVRYLGLS